MNMAVTDARCDSLLPRFEGPARMDRICEVLRSQNLVAGEHDIAKALVPSVMLRELKAGEKLIEQGAADTELHFVIGGSFQIFVNGREVAVRRQNQHIGEMSLLEITARRSATATAIEPSLVASISEAAFSAVANAHPQIWRRIAIGLSHRLKERSRHYTSPRNQPVVFLGSSSENIEVVRAIQSDFAHDRFVVVPWTTNVFTASTTPIESLVKAMHETDFSAFVVNPNDVTISRDISLPSPRDNVIFELGLFIGRIGRNRTFLVKERGSDIKIPTDLLGVKPIEYAAGAGDTLPYRIGPACNELRALINKIGPI